MTCELWRKIGPVLFATTNQCSQKTCSINQICFSHDIIAVNILRCNHITDKSKMLLSVLMKEERAEEVNASQFAQMNPEVKI